MVRAVQIMSIFVAFSAAFAFSAGGKKGGDPPLIITSKGKMILEYGTGKQASFYDTVELRDTSGTLKSDKLTVFFNKEKSSDITMAIAEGNVFIYTEDSSAKSDKAIFYSKDNMVKLTGNPVIYRGRDAYSAEIITIYRDDDRVVFEPSAQLVIYDKVVQETDEH